MKLTQQEAQSLFEAFNAAIRSSTNAIAASQVLNPLLAKIMETIGPNVKEEQAE